MPFGRFIKQGNGVKPHEPQTMFHPLLFLGPAGGLLGLAAAFGYYRRMASSVETDGSQESTVKRTLDEMGATSRQLSQWTLALIGSAFIALLMLYFAGLGPASVAPALFLGGLCSAATSFLSALLATKASNRLREDLDGGDLPRTMAALQASGAVVGLTSSGVVLLFVSAAVVLMSLFRTLSLSESSAVIVSFGFGACLQALLSQLAGGLAGRASRLVPNQASDPSGGEVAATSCDLSDSYSSSLFAAICLAVTAATAVAPSDTVAQGKAASLPLAVAGLGMLASLAGLPTKPKDCDGASRQTCPGALPRALALSGTLVSLGSGALSYLLLKGLTLPGTLSWKGFWGSIVIGQLLTLMSARAWGPPTRPSDSPEPSLPSLAEAARQLFGGWPLLAGLGFGCLLSFGLCGGFIKPPLGLFGIALTSVGLLSTLGLSLAFSSLPSIIYDATHNRTSDQALALRSHAHSALTFARTLSITSAALTALSLLAAYGEQLKVQLIKATGDGSEIRVWATHDVDQVAARELTLADLMNWYDATLLNPLVLFGLLLGACTVFALSALAVRDTAQEALTRTCPPAESEDDTVSGPKAIQEVGRRAGRRLLLPLIGLVVIPLSLSVTLGPASVMGHILGGLCAGVPLALLLSGTEWAHGRVVANDWEPNSPLKEAGSSILGVAIKLPALTAVVFAGLAVKLAPSVAKALGLF